MGIRIISGGLLTTVQDRGRHGYMRFGMTPAGAMDERSYMIANLLVGNEGGEAALEATVIPPQLEFTSSAVFAVTGGDFRPLLNGREIPVYSACRAQAGDRLTFGGRRTGCRVYIAFQGGLDVPEVMGSRSTDLKAGIGGLQGRRLNAGDELEFLPAESAGDGTAALPEDFSGGETFLRVIPGPQDDRFTREGMETFLTTAYTVTEKSDRMGCRLEGRAIETACGSDIITDGICMGAVQVPADGRPIIMMADRQPTGGYVKIANIISVDLPRVAQLMPGDAVQFRRVGVEEAQQLLLEQAEDMKRIRRRAAETTEHRYRVTVNGTAYEVTVEKVDEKGE